jgi:L-threonylcarbamoyladenylate synthase
VVIFSQKGWIIELMSQLNNAAGQFISHCTTDAMVAAAEKLKSGSLVAFPTETVYGLGADATNAVHLSSMQGAADWAADIPDYAIALARAYWPGPMTLIFKRSELAQDFVTGGQDTVGVRVPDHAIAQALLKAFESIGGKGIAAPSANRFGHVSPTTAQAVSEELSAYLAADDVILDGGPSQVGVESTIIDCTSSSPRILRPGAITEEMVVAATGSQLSQSGTEIRVSGSLENHYAPQAKVILDVAPQPGDGFLALAEVETPAGVIRLAAPLTHEEFARTLYSSLRSADQQKLARVVVHQPLGDDIAVAIRDRLERASAPGK